ncbi:surf-like protein [Apophysomyces sp. BC1034]|nr:surf-like protein [Apophysomyces sp. BC1015]KAG0182273.1 surf-like protein [Apophysomyces sp. BC1021]KAG0192892.1 surf-like protein [Apophysomyces sp. BC1034]
MGRRMPRTCARFMSTEAPQQQYRVKQRSFGLGTALMCTVPFITFGLGTWQVQRLRWKVNLIGELEERMVEKAIPLPRRINKDVLDEYEYKRVTTTGKYRHDLEITVGPRTRGDGEVGYFLITPLERENGSTVLVKRGWVHSSKRDQSARPESLEQGTVEVVGLLRMSEQRNTFTPDNNIAKNEWYWVDVDTISNMAGAEPFLIERVTDKSPYVEHDLIQKGIPVGRSPLVEIRNNHMQYIITWYALSIATTGMLWKLLRKPVNRPLKIKRN